MKVAIVGDFSDNLDEGYKNVAHNLADALAEHVHIRRLNAKGCFRPDFWLGVMQARADIVHIITQPTSAGLLLLRMIASFQPRARRVVSCLRVERLTGADGAGRVLPLALGWAAPDLVLVQESTVRGLFDGPRIGNVRKLANGVDASRFQAVGPQRRLELRQKHGVSASRPLLLHVGHLRQQRNLLCLGDLADQGYQVVVLGSTYLGVDWALVEALKEKGVTVLIGYQPNVEEFYQIADCYVFPVSPGSTISMPLSVLEALACKLPVVTRRFMALEEAFGEGKGLYFFATDGELRHSVRRAIQASIASEASEFAQPQSWQSVAEELLAMYEDLAPI